MRGPARLTPAAFGAVGFFLVVTLLGVMFLAPVGVSRSSGATTSIAVPASVDATGTRDVTAALTIFFAGLGPGITVTFPSAGRYRAEGTVIVAGSVDLTIEGNGATIFASTDGSNAAPPRRGFSSHWPRRREHLEFRQTTGLVVRNLTIRGANPHAGANRAAYVPELEGQAGIALISSRDVVLDNVSVTHTFGDLVYIGGGTIGVTITRSRLTDSGRQGVAIVNATNVTVTNTDISGIARSVFDLEPPGRALARDIRLEGNRIGEYVNFLLAAQGGGPGVEGVQLENNRVSASRGLAVVAGVTRVTRHDLQITGNRGTARARPLTGFGSGAMIQLTNLDRVIIRDNNQPVVTATSAVSLDRVCHLTMSGNDFPGAGGAPQELAPCGGPAGPITKAPVRPNPGGLALRAATGPDTTHGSTNTGVILAAAGLGLAAGLALAGVIWWLVRRRSNRGDRADPVDPV